MSVPGVPLQRRTSAMPKVKVVATLKVKVYIAYGTMNIADAIERSRRAAAAGDCAIVVGVTRFARSHHGCWQVCLSWQGGPVTWVSAHRLKQSADQQIEPVCQAVRQGRLTDDTQFAALLQELPTHGDPDLQQTLDSAPEPMVPA